jgi:hypothetical protein
MTHDKHDILFSFDTRDFRRFPQKTHDALRLVSNHLYEHTDTKIGALVAMRGKYAEFAVSKAGLDYLWKAVSEERIPDGIVVLAYRDGGGYVVVNQMDIDDVMESLKVVPPRVGEWGEYWWFNRDGTPQRLGGGPSHNQPPPLEEAPW